MRPAIGPPTLRLLFGEEPLGIQVGDGPAAVTKALPAILAALDVHVSTETIHHIQAQTTLPADLVLELVDPTIAEVDGTRRASAVATLTYVPPDGSPNVESARYKLTAPLGPIEAEEMAWYL